MLADWNGAGAKRAVVIATGSEVALAMGAREALAEEGIAVRVVSMPCTSVFDRQDAAYRASVLPPGVPRVAVEAGVDRRLAQVRRRGRRSRAARSSASTRFGESAPAGALFKHFGFTVENVVAAVKRVPHERWTRRDRARCSIRRATAGDAPAIARVRIDSWRTTYRGLIPDAYLDGMQVDASTALWDRVLTAGPNTTSVFVAEHDADDRRLRLRHTCCAEPKHGLDAELAAVYLRREFQRAGLGRRLVAAVVDAQRAHGATGSLTWVIAGNKAARAFYESLGGELLVEQPFQWDGMDWSRPATAGAISTRSPPPAARSHIGAVTWPRCESISSGAEHDDQGWHQRLRPHRPQGACAPRCGTSPTSRSSPSTTCSSPTTSPTCCSYDSVHGRFKGTIAVDGSTLVVNGKKIRLTAVKDPAELQWGEVGADVVVESTGLFLTKETAGKHIAAGAKKVIMSAPVARTTRRCSCSASTTRRYAGAGRSSPTPPARPTASRRWPRCCTTTGASSAA